jgi:hypothetical protein
MPYCSLCGVEVDEPTVKCPLCRAPIQKFADAEHPDRRYPVTAAPSPHGVPKSLIDRLRLARVITSFGFLIPVFILVSIDLFLNRSLTWSRFAGGSLLLLWVWTLSVLFFSRNPWILTWISASVTSLFLLFLDGNDGTLTWSLFPGSPIPLAAGLVATAAIVLIKKSKRKGINIAGIIILAVCFFSVCVDMVIRYFLIGRWGLGWSLIVLGSGFPVAVLLFYLHIALGRESKLKRFFHL